ncbi:MAG TPA: transglycosylase SLT domain-containing protein [Candidatus Paceibacterota bacterium]|nr:transglycosylase SLT domain-containing protein [Candidatus Paceibacterota bacterium]
MHSTASILLALSAVFNVNPGSQLPAPMPQVQTVNEYVREYFKDEPVLADIAQCESQMRQFDKNGNTIKNPTSSAIGIMQIMASIHKGTAEKLGLDIYSVQGNLAYAKYLYDREGTTPWNASKNCWGKKQNSAPALAATK